MARVTSAFLLPSSTTEETETDEEGAEEEEGGAGGSSSSREEARYVRIPEGRDHRVPPIGYERQPTGGHVVDGRGRCLAYPPPAHVVNAAIVTIAAYGEIVPL